MPTARVDIILYIADRNDSPQISFLMNTCCEFFSWPKFLMAVSESRLKIPAESLQDAAREDDG